MGFDDSMKKAEQMKNKIQNMQNSNINKTISFGDGIPSRFSKGEGRSINENGNMIPDSITQDNSKNND